MIGYKYITEQEAINAVTLCNSHYGYPKQDTTTNWIDFQYSDLDGFFYIIFDESVENILGQPIEFEITLPNII